MGSSIIQVKRLLAQVWALVKRYFSSFIINMPVLLRTTAALAFLITVTAGQTRHLGETCADSDECGKVEDLRLKCVEGICTCPEYSHYVPKCPRYHEPCNTSAPCFESLQCVEGRCECGDKYFIPEGNLYLNELKLCDKKETYHGKCFQKDACLDSLGLVCVNGLCLCPVFKSYHLSSELNISESCTDELLYGESCGGSFFAKKCRKDLGLVCIQNRCVCEPDGLWIAKTQTCVGRNLPCGNNILDQLWACKQPLEHTTKYVSTLRKGSLLMEKAFYLCGKQLDDGMLCIKGIDEQCPNEHEPWTNDLEPNPVEMIRRYTELKTWRDKHCGSSNYAEFENQQDCVMRSVQSDVYMNCVKEVPEPDFRTLLYQCGAREEAKQCFDSTIGMNCSEAAAEIAFSAAELLLLKDNCSTSGVYNWGCTSNIGILVAVTLSILLKRVLP